MIDEKKIKRPLRKKIIRGGVNLILLLTLLTYLFLFVFINSSNFRKPVLSEVTSIVNRALNADISIKDLQFSAIGEVVLVKPKLFLEADTICKADVIAISLNLNTVLKNQYILNSVILNNVDFNLRIFLEFK